MLRATVLLVALAFLASGQAKDLCVPECSNNEPRILKYITGKTYIYDLQTSISSVNITENIISANVNITVLGPCLWRIKMSTSNVSVLAQIEDGLLRGVCMSPHADLSRDNINYHMAALSTLQVSPLSLNVAEWKGLEMDMMGICPTDYRITQNTEKGDLTVQKIKDLRYCTRSFLSQDAQKISLAMTDSLECKQEIRKGVIRSSRCSQKTDIFVIPLSLLTSVTMDLVNIVTTPDILEEEESSQFVRLENKTLQTSERPITLKSMAIDMLNVLCWDLKQKILSLVRTSFHEVVVILSHLEEVDLEEVVAAVNNGSVCGNDTYFRNLMWDAMAQGNSPISAKFYLEKLMKNNTEAALQWEVANSNFRLIRTPRNKTIEAVMSVMKKTMEPEMCLAVAALINNYCISYGSDSCLNATVTMEFFQFLSNMTGQQCERYAELENQKLTIMTVLQAYSIMRHAGKNGTATILACSRNTNLPENIRLEALDVIHDLRCSQPMLEEMIAIYTNRSESMELRINAHLVTLHCLNTLPDDKVSKLKMVRDSFLEAKIQRSKKLWAFTSEALGLGVELRKDLLIGGGDRYQLDANIRGTTLHLMELQVPTDSPPSATVLGREVLPDSQGGATVHLPKMSLLRPTISGDLLRMTASGAVSGRGEVKMDPGSVTLQQPGLEAAFRVHMGLQSGGPQIRSVVTLQTTPPLDFRVRLDQGGINLQLSPGEVQKVPLLELTHRTEVMDSDGMVHESEPGSEDNKICKKINFGISLCYSGQLPTFSLKSLPQFRSQINWKIPETFKKYDLNVGLPNASSPLTLSLSSEDQPQDASLYFFSPEGDAAPTILEGKLRISSQKYRKIKFTLEKNVNENKVAYMPSLSLESEKDERLLDIRGALVLESDDKKKVILFNLFQNANNPILKGSIVRAGSHISHLNDEGVVTLNIEGRIKDVSYALHGTAEIDRNSIVSNADINYSHPSLSNQTLRLWSLLRWSSTRLRQVVSGKLRLVHLQVPQLRTSVMMQIKCLDDFLNSHRGASLRVKNGVDLENIIDLEYMVSQNRTGARTSESHLVLEVPSKKLNVNLHASITTSKRGGRSHPDTSNLHLKWLRDSRSPYIRTSLVWMSLQERNVKFIEGTEWLGGGKYQGTMFLQLKRNHGLHVMYRGNRFDRGLMLETTSRTLDGQSEMEHMSLIHLDNEIFNTNHTFTIARDQTFGFNAILSLKRPSEMQVHAPQLGARARVNIPDKDGFFTLSCNKNLLTYNNIDSLFKFNFSKPDVKVTLSMLSDESPHKKILLNTHVGVTPGNSENYLVDISGIKDKDNIKILFKRQNTNQVRKRSHQFEMELNSDQENVLRVKAEKFQFPSNQKKVFTLMTGGSLIPSGFASLQQQGDETVNVTVCAAGQVNCLQLDAENGGSRAITLHQGGVVLRVAARNLSPSRTSYRLDLASKSLQAELALKGARREAVVKLGSPRGPEFGARLMYEPGTLFGLMMTKHPESLPQTNEDAWPVTDDETSDIVPLDSDDDRGLSLCLVQPSQDVATYGFVIQRSSASNNTSKNSTNIIDRISNAIIDYYNEVKELVEALREALKNPFSWNWVISKIFGKEKLDSTHRWAANLAGSFVNRAWTIFKSMESRSNADTQEMVTQLLDLLKQKACSNLGICIQVADDGSYRLNAPQCEALP